MEPARTLRFACDGDGLPLLGIYLKTILLSIVTLGIYSFWGRTEIRRFLWNSILVGDDRLRYHGTGLELFKGWLKAIGILICISIVVYGLALGLRQALVGLFFYVAAFLLTPFAIVGAQRYRLSRTSLRGIHFRSTAKSTEFAPVFYKGLLLTLVTVGFYAPYFANNVYGYLTRHTYYGDQPFNYDGEGKDLFGSWVLTILLFIPTLYLMFLWFSVKQQNYFASRTTYRSGRFSLELSFWSVLALLVTNALMVVFTLGIAYPWAVLRSMRFYCSNLRLENFTGFGDARQRAAAASATGEEIASVMDIDTDFGGAGLDL